MDRTATPAFGTLLKHYRLAAGLTQEALAERAGISARAVSDLERGGGRLPRLETLRLLVEALGLPAGQRAEIWQAARRGRGSGPPDVQAESLATLPVATTPLLGREQEVAAVTVLLHRADVRLVTLTGPGGVGKTRLALRVAHDLVPHYADGVAFVSLASLSDPLLVPATLAAALGVVEAAGHPLPDRLAGYLRDKRMLVVLDNVEHLADACAELLGGLVVSCPRLALLATGRAPLGLTGEWEFPVPPLLLPEPGERVDAADLPRYPAVTLFLDRARAVAPDVDLSDAVLPAVAEICRRLDGLPLAIELAAARVRLLPPPALLARLEPRLPLLTDGPRDLPPRQRTLRQTIDWSYALLTAAERTLFARFAVFAGGATLEAIEAVGEAGSRSSSHLDSLTALVRASLIRRGEPRIGEARFSMLETIREYATERLEATGAADRIRGLHAAYYLALAERAEPALWGGPEQQVWVDRLEAEQDNLRACLAWAAERGDSDLSLRLVSALGWYWFIQGQAVEGRRWVEQALAGAPSDLADLRARAMAYLGRLAIQQGDPATSVPSLEASLTLFQTLDDERWTAWTCWSLGAALLDSGEQARGLELIEASLALSHDRGKEWGSIRGLPLGVLGLTLLGQDDAGATDRAVTLLEEALALGHETRNAESQGLALMGLGWAALYGGDAARATMLLEEAETRFRSVRHYQGVLDARMSLGWVLLDAGEVERAAGLFTAGIMLARERGSQARVVECLRGLGAVAGRQGDAERAALLFGAAERLQEMVGSMRVPIFPAYQRALRSTRALLDDATWSAAWQRGRATPLEDVVAPALSIASSTER